MVRPCPVVVKLNDEILENLRSDSRTMLDICVLPLDAEGDNMLTSELKDGAYVLVYAFIARFRRKNMNISNTVKTMMKTTAPMVASIQMLIGCWSVLALPGSSGCLGFWLSGGRTLTLVAGRVAALSDAVGVVALLAMVPATDGPSVVVLWTLLPDLMCDPVNTTLRTAELVETVCAGDPVDVNFGMVALTTENRLVLIHLVGVLLVMTVLDGLPANGSVLPLMTLDELVATGGVLPLTTDVLLTTCDAETVDKRHLALRPSA